MKKLTKVIENNNSTDKKVVLLIKEAIQPHTLTEAGSDIITVITKNKILALLSNPTKYM